MNVQDLRSAVRALERATCDRRSLDSIPRSLAASLAELAKGALDVAGDRRLTVGAAARAEAQMIAAQLGRESVELLRAAREGRDVPALWLQSYNRRVGRVGALMGGTAKPYATRAGDWRAQAQQRAARIAELQRQVAEDARKMRAGR